MKARVQRVAARDNSTIVAHSFNQYSMEVARIVAKRFQGDIDSYFILCAISVASVGYIVADPKALQRYPSVDDRIEEDYAWVRLLPLAEISGMPRTTVRRKVARLMDLGYVEHDAHLGYRIAKGSMAKCPHLRKIMQAQVALMLRLFNAMLGEEVIALQPGGARVQRKLASVGKPMK